MKRLLDILFSSIGLIILSPVFILTILFITIYDFKNPIYISKRMGKKMIPFKMYKLRSMRVDADSYGINSTSKNDPRLTPIGKIIRKIKLDEFSQLLNVLIGNMSLVGPRPQVVDHVNNEYTNLEKKLLNVEPGITDISSIVFSDENEILKDSSNPDKDYNELIRPWKSRLGLIYIKNQSILLDFKLIIITIIAILNKSIALKFLNKILINLNVNDDILSICLRKDQLLPFSPPK